MYKCKKLNPGFELGSLCPFPINVTIALCKRQNEQFHMPSNWNFYISKLMIQTDYPK